nr:TetR family transcriptional regulator [Mycolicibacterium baixiangningiae]
MDRRERIVAAALHLATDGYDAVHIRTVAGLADVAPSTVYQYFSSKDDVLVACLLQWLSTCEPHAHAAVDGLEDPYHRLLQLADFVTARLWAQPALADALTRAYLCADSGAATNADLVRNSLSRMLAAAMGRDQPTLGQRQIGELVADILSSTLLALVQQRSTTADSRIRLRRTIAVLSRHDAGRCLAASGSAAG